MELAPQDPSCGLIFRLSSPVLTCVANYLGCVGTDFEKSEHVARPIQFRELPTNLKLSSEVASVISTYAGNSEFASTPGHIGEWHVVIS